MKTIWTIKEQRNGLWVPVLQRTNVTTTYGLSNLAALGMGAGVLPQYLLVDNFFATLDTGVSVGALSVTASQPVHLSGDTQLVLSGGGLNQETVTFSSAVTNTDGSCTYTIAATTQNHFVGDYVCRAPLATDVVSTIQTEMQVDPIVLPGNRLQYISGFPNGTGAYVLQFAVTGTQAVGVIMGCGLVDTSGIGTGNLHNHVVYGYNHQYGVDIEVDIQLTIS